MRPTLSGLPSKTRVVKSAAPSEVDQPHPEVPDREVRNFLVLALYQIVMRTGWIFKTESVVMPAVLDMIGGSAWLRGCLPVLNRFGQSVPPLLFSRRLKNMPHKKRALALCTLGMSGSFLVLAGMFLFHNPVTIAWMPAIFLLLYTVFFVFNGMNQLAFGMLQGKLVQATRRGRLLLASSTIGAASGILFAWLLLRYWLRPDGGEFHLIFGFAAMCFAIAASTMLLLVEPADNYRQAAFTVKQHFAAAWAVLRRDANFRRLAVVAMMFGTSMMLFPHYQPLARERLGLRLDMLMWWVIVQNAGTALFSVMAGPLADWRGNRVVLRLVTLGIACVPILAIALAHAPEAGKPLYSLVFLAVGMTPVVLKTMNNYTLEICEPADHARYLSTLGLCVAVPLLFSPLVGLLVDVTNFETVFFGTSVLLLIGWVMTFSLTEPRHHVTTPPPDAAMIGTDE